MKPYGLGPRCGSTLCRCAAVKTKRLPPRPLRGRWDCCTLCEDHFIRATRHETAVIYKTILVGFRTSSRGTRSSICNVFSLPHGPHGPHWSIRVATPTPPRVTTGPTVGMERLPGLQKCEQIRAAGVNKVGCIRAYCCLSGRIQRVGMKGLGMN